jgi:hypothetical protein
LLRKEASRPVQPEKRRVDVALDLVFVSLVLVALAGLVFVAGADSRDGNDWTKQDWRKR